MQRHGKTFTPTLMTGVAPLSAEQKQFVVEVVYVPTTATAGTTAVYGGRFYAANASLAEVQARGFVTRYLRPSTILDVLVQPTT